MEDALASVKPIAARYTRDVQAIMDDMSDEYTKLKQIEKYSMWELDADKTPWGTPFGLKRSPAYCLSARLPERMLLWSDMNDAEKMYNKLGEELGGGNFFGMFKWGAEGKLRELDEGLDGWGWQWGLGRGADWEV